MSVFFRRRAYWFLGFAGIGSKVYGPAQSEEVRLPYLRKGTLTVPTFKP